jgi:hypothetical protein
VHRLLALLLVATLLMAPVSEAALSFLTGEGSDHGTDSTLDNLVPITVCSWVYPTTFDSNFRRIAIKRVDGTNEWDFQISGALSGAFAFTRRYSVANAIATSAASTLTTNTWSFVCAGFDGTLAPKLYHGTLTTPVAEVSYNGTPTAPSGTNGDDSAGPLVVGHRPGLANSNVLGRIAWVGVWNETLTLGQLRAQQFRPRKTATSKLFVHYGYNGTGTQTDWSGLKHHGTLTGGAIGAHVPLGAGQ